ncbi:hypothetical protein D3C72_1240560 [compost metagenome]
MAGNQHVVLGDKAAFAHVDQGAAQGGCATATRDWERLALRRAPARLRHGLGLGECHKQQLVAVRHDDIVSLQVAQGLRLQRAGADRGLGGGRKAVGQERQQVVAGRILGMARCLVGHVGEAASAGHQAHTHFHQADVAFHVRHAACAVQQQLAAAAQRHAVHSPHHRYLRIAHGQEELLHNLLDLVDGHGALQRKGGHHGLQIGTHAERGVARPDDQGVKVLLGKRQCSLQVFHHIGADGVHLGLDAEDQHLVIQRPGTRGLALGQGSACRAPILRCVACLAQHALGEQLARIHR